MVHALTASWLRFGMVRYEAMPVGRSQHRAGTVSFEKRGRRLGMTVPVGWSGSEPGKGPVRWYPLEFRS